MSVEYRAVNGHATYIETSEQSWSTSWDLDDDVTLLVALFTAFYNPTPSYVRFNSVDFDVEYDTWDYSTHIVYSLLYPPTDTSYTIECMLPSSQKYWAIMIASFAGTSDNPIGALSTSTSSSYSLTPSGFDSGDLTLGLHVVHADSNPTDGITTGTQIAWYHNDSSGNGENGTQMTYSPTGTVAGTLSGSGAIDPQAAALNLKAGGGANQLILAMSSIADKLDKIFKRDKYGLYKPKHDGILVPRPI